jgi:hypothetical protein
MTLYLKDFTGIKKEFLDFYKKRGIRDIGFFCATGGLPIIAAASFILEIEPENKEAMALRDRTMKFYGYTEVK